MHLKDNIDALHVLTYFRSYR